MHALNKVLHDLQRIGVNDHEDWTENSVGECFLRLKKVLKENTEQRLYKIHFRNLSSLASETRSITLLHFAENQQHCLWVRDLGRWDVWLLNKVEFCQGIWAKMHFEISPTKITAEFSSAAAFQTKEFLKCFY